MKHTGEFGPCRDRLGFSLYRDQMIVSFIAALLFLSGPAAVPWLIVAVVVLALKLHPWRASSHVSKKVLKTGTPPLAHRNAPPLIIGIVLGKATGFGMCPRFIFTGLVHAMSSRFLCNQFSLEAAATVGPATAKVGSIDDVFSAALAPHEPVCPFGRPSNVRQPNYSTPANGQSGEVQVSHTRAYSRRLI